uniref:Uncharacterized protein n=1 Tax=Oryza meridionalis TaxID=40149 RepID=A0A0E0DGX5_9ORYZ
MGLSSGATRRRAAAAGAALRAVGHGVAASRIPIRVAMAAALWSELGGTLWSELGATGSRWGRSWSRPAGVELGSGRGEELGAAGGWRGRLERMLRSVKSMATVVGRAWSWPALVTARRFLVVAVVPVGCCRRRSRRDGLAL